MTTYTYSGFVLQGLGSKIKDKAGDAAGAVKGKAKEVKKAVTD